MSSSPADSPGPKAPNSWLHQASAWIPVLVCIAAIATESTPAFGADHTTGPLQRFVEALFHRHFTSTEWWQLHHIIRKCGHFLGYGIVSIAWFRAFWMTWHVRDTTAQRQWNAHRLAMLGTFLVAASDEIHQIFLPNRTASIIDVGIDCLGGLLMQALISLWMRRRARS